MSTLIYRHGDASPLPYGWLARIASGIASCWSGVRRERQVRLTSAELRALDDRMLKDIGLQRFQINSAVPHGERFGWYAPLADTVWAASLIPRSHRTLTGNDRPTGATGMTSDTQAGGPDDRLMLVQQNEDEHFVSLEGTARIVRGNETFEAPTATTVALSTVAAEHPTTRQTAGSSLVRRLVRAKNDPAKQRIRSWLGNMKDGQLLSLGVTSEEIAALRGTAGTPDEAAISQGCDMTSENSIHEVFR
jgi:uncharacterized protein YjiS (DUF1127 family)